jgi:hypothetical protein
MTVRDRPESRVTVGLEQNKELGCEPFRTSFVRLLHLLAVLATDWQGRVGASRATNPVGRKTAFCRSPASRQSRPTKRKTKTFSSMTLGSVSIELYDLSDAARLGSADAEKFPVPSMPTDPRIGWREWTKAEFDWRLDR